MALKVTKANVNAGGVVGENTIWDGPLNQVGRPHKRIQQWIQRYEIEIS